MCCSPFDLGRAEWLWLWLCLCLFLCQSWPGSFRFSRAVATTASVALQRFGNESRATLSLIEMLVTKPLCRLASPPSSSPVRPYQPPRHPLSRSRLQSALRIPAKIQRRNQEIVIHRAAAQGTDQHKNRHNVRAAVRPIHSRRRPGWKQCGQRRWQPAHCSSSSCRFLDRPFFPISRAMLPEEARPRSDNWAGTSFRPNTDQVQPALRAFKLVTTRFAPTEWSL